MIALELTGKSFGTAPVLGACVLRVERGETVTIAGPSGAGKTTLLRILAGLDDDFDGRLQTQGRPAMVFQEPVLLPWRSTLDNITLASRASREVGLRSLEEVGLDGLADRFPRQLSLGQQRRLSMARAMAAAPDILLMDEPFVSLDPALVEEMLTLTKRLLDVRDIATVLVTHNPAEARRLATRQLRLSGRPAVLTGLAD